MIELIESALTFLHASIVSLSIVMASAASAQVIECTGKDGRKEFAQTCPPGTVKQRQLANSSATKPEASSDGVYAGNAQKSTNDLELEFQQRRIAREQEADKADKLEQADKSKCAAVKQRLDIYENARGIKKIDPATGKWNIVEDDQRAATLQQLRHDAKQCR